MQDCSIFIINAMEILQTCNKPSTDNPFHILPQNPCAQRDGNALYWVAMLAPEWSGTPCRESMLYWCSQKEARIGRTRLFNSGQTA